MTPTAEDILRKVHEELSAPNPTDWKTFDEIMKDGTGEAMLKAMEEYSLLKSKEAADKAWEAGENYEHEKWTPVIPEADDRQSAPDKETFMKELFKDQRS